MIVIRQRAWFFAIVGGALVSAFVLGGTVLRGQAERWYPSRWGANDQRGAANRITPAKRSSSPRSVVSVKFNPA